MGGGGGCKATSVYVTGFKTSHDDTESSTGGLSKLTSACDFKHPYLCRKWKGV